MEIFIVAQAIDLPAGDPKAILKSLYPRSNIRRADQVGHRCQAEAGLLRSGSRCGGRNGIVIGMMLNFRSPIAQGRLDLLDSLPRQSNAVRDSRRSVCY